MSEQARQTNAAWNMFTRAGVLGSLAFNDNPEAQRTILNLAVGIGVGGNIAHRIYQETGDMVLANVGVRRGVLAVMAMRVMVFAILGVPVSLFLIIGGLCSLGRPESALALVGLLMLGACWGGFCFYNNVKRENVRLMVTGIPADKDCRKAGYIRAAGYWVRPNPGCSVEDVLREHGVDTSINVQEALPWGDGEESPRPWWMG